MGGPTRGARCTLETLARVVNEPAERAVPAFGRLAVVDEFAAGASEAPRVATRFRRVGAVGAGRGGWGGWREVVDIE